MSPVADRTHERYADQAPLVKPRPDARPDGLELTGRGSADTLRNTCRLPNERRTRPLGCG